MRPRPGAARTSVPAASRPSRREGRPAPPGSTSLASAPTGAARGTSHPRTGNRHRRRRVPRAAARALDRWPRPPIAGAGVRPASRRRRRAACGSRGRGAHDAGRDPTAPSNGRDRPGLPGCRTPCPPDTERGHRGSTATCRSRPASSSRARAHGRGPPPTASGRGRNRGRHQAGCRPPPPSAASRRDAATLPARRPRSMDRPAAGRQPSDR